MADEHTTAPANEPARTMRQVLELVLQDAYHDSSGYYLIRPHTLDEVRRALNEVTHDGS